MIVFARVPCHRLLAIFLNLFSLRAICFDKLKNVADIIIGNSISEFSKIFQSCVCLMNKSCM